MFIIFQLRDQLGRVAEVYMEIYEDFSDNDTKSYIGLRDFYCLVCEIWFYFRFLIKKWYCW